MQENPKAFYDMKHENQIHEGETKSKDMVEQEQTAVGTKPGDFAGKVTSRRCIWSTENQ